MRVGVLLLTHEAIGSALIGAARHVLDKLPLALEAIEVSPDADTDALLREASARVKTLDSGDGVLVLTDLYGATPSNLAQKLATQGMHIHRVAGLNLPMLLRVLNYPDQALHDLAETATSGGRAGILIDHA